MLGNIQKEKSLAFILIFIFSVFAAAILFSVKAYGYIRAAELYIYPEDIDYFQWEVYPSENFRHKVQEIDNVMGDDLSLIVDFEYKTLGVCSEGLISYQDISGKWGFMDMEGTIVIPAIYDGVAQFSDELCIVKIEDSYFYIDRAENRYFEGIIHPSDWRSTNESYFYEGVALARIDYPESGKREQGLIRNPLYEEKDIKKYDGNIKIIVQGEELECDILPMIIEESTYVPLRAICEALGFEVNYNTTGFIELNNEEEQHILNLNNGIIVNDRAMVPVRYIGEELRFIVEWYQYTKTIMIYR